MAHHRTLGTDVAIARIFNTYGPRLRPDDGRVVSNFLLQALRGEPLTVYGDGSQTRSLCYVDDEVPGLIALFDSDLTGPVNIGNPDELHRPRAGPHRGRAARVRLADRSPPPSGRRPHPSPAGHHAGPDANSGGSRPPVWRGPGRTPRRAVADEVGALTAAPPTSGRVVDDSGPDAA